MALYSAGAMLAFGGLRAKAAETPTVSIDSHNPSPSTVGQAYAVQVTVSGASGTPTGSVTINDGDGHIDTITLSGGTGSGTITSTSAGAKTLTASYGGDGVYDPGSTTASHTVNKASPGVTISSDASDPSTYATSYTVEVSVTGPGVTPTGTVSLNDGDGNISTITLSGGTGSATVTPVSAGSKTLTASYGGDANYLTGSDTEAHTVDKATPTVAITSDDPDWNNVHVSVPVTFTVTPPNGGTPTGTVTVRDETGITTTVDVTAGTATLTGMPVGFRTITATYNGDGNFNSAGDTEAHEVRGPDLSVEGGGLDIADGDSSPSAADDTDYGSSGSYPYVVTKTYTIRNDGNDTLNLIGPSPVSLAGVDPGPYTVTQPAVLVLAPGESTTFSITFAPEVAGAMAAEVRIASDDFIKPEFDYAITGMIVPSAIDLTYNPGVGPNQKVIDVEVQEDGKAVVVGAFITYSGVGRKYVARINVDGSLDTTFDPGTGASHQINAVDIHTGGKILIGGRFTTFDGTTVGRVARLNTDGTLDTSFQTVSGGADGEVFATAVQPDRKILIGGAFTHVSGSGRVRIARLNEDGTLDTTFDAGNGPDLNVRFIELQADGKILVGGHFRKWNGVNTSRIVRLNADGTVDNTFSSPFPDNGYVTEIIKDESDGDIYVSGGTRRLVRLNNDGSLQWDVGLTFNSDPNAILLTQDGKIITGGYFTTFGGTPRTRLARLNSDGTLNGVFDPQPGANKRFLRLALQPDGRIIGVGEFTTYRGETRNFITRMINDIRLAPFFSLEPSTQTVEEGTVFTLSSMAEGELPVDYQWYKDGVAMTDTATVTGTTSKDLVFSTIEAADAATYHVVATNPNGSATSSSAAITVEPNHAPTFDVLSNLALNEDAPLQTVNLTGVSNGAAHESGQILTITATSGDTDIVPNPTVTYTSGATTGTVTFTPVANAFGTATITVTATDDGQTVNGGITTLVRTFDVVIASVNDTPTLTLTPTTFAVNEDSGAFSQAGFATFSQGPANESGQTLSLVSNNSNPGLFSAAPAINGTTGELTFTPAADANGTATVTVYAQDNGGGADTSPTRSFTIVVNAVNDQPSFTLDASTVNFVEDSGFNQVTLITSTVRGPANETTQKVDRYEITGNTNPGLITGLEVTSNGILKATTVSGVTGSTVVTIRLVDNGGTPNGGIDTSVAQSFTITVGPPNFPPDFDLAANLYTHLEDSGAQSVANFVSNVGPGDVSEAGQTVTFTITAANPALFASGPTLTANGADYDLSYTLAADAFGSTLVTVTGTDDGPGTAAQTKTFTVTITGVNDAPSFVFPGGAVVSSQTLWTWGYGGGGGLGNGSQSDGLSPGQISADTKWKTVAAGTMHALALKTDGTLFAWGNNYYGSLGDGSTTSRSNPVQIGTDTDWKSVTSRDWSTLAIKTDGTLWAWGRNNYGQFGDGTTTDNATRAQIGTDTDWQSVVSGEFHTLAIKTDGTLWAWGRNIFGELGDGTTTDRLTPVRVGSDTDWATVDVGQFHSLAQKSDGSLWAWGNNGDGQLGDGTSSTRKTPIQVGTDTDWTVFSAGRLHSTATKSDGTLWVWGRNGYAQLGLGDTTRRLAPVQLGAETNWQRVSAGYRHTVALKSDGTIWAWGGNSVGQVGDGTRTDRRTPVQAGSATDWQLVAAGYDFNVGFAGSGAAAPLILAVNESSGATTESAFATGISAGPANESTQTLAFHISNDNNSLFDTQPAIDSGSGDLTFTLAAGANGSATVSVYLTDNGGTDNGGDDSSDTQTFTITVSPVNNEPSVNFAAVTVTVLEDAGAQTVSAHATMDPGAPDESGQTALGYTVSNDNNALFSVQPAIDTSGNLTFTPAADAAGTATVSVAVQDDGGTVDGGDDTSQVATFVIAVTEVNDEPSFTLPAGSGGSDEYTVSTLATGLDSPLGSVVASDGTLYVADFNNDLIRAISPAGVVSTVAGGTEGSADGIGTAARFNGPWGIVLASGNILYVTELSNDTIRRIDLATGEVTTVAGSAGDNDHVDGTLSASRFDGPRGLAIGSDGILYVADAFNHVIRKVDVAGDSVTTLAGTVGTSGFQDGALGVAQFNRPTGIAVDGSHVVYVTEENNQALRKVATDGTVTLFAGAQGSGSLDGTSSLARFRDPIGIAVDSSGNVFLAEQGNDTIRKVTPAGVVSRIAGAFQVTGTTDGAGLDARFDGPAGIAVDSSGNLYVSDRFSDTIRKLSAAGGAAEIAVSEGSGAATESAFATSISAGPASEAGQTLTFNVSNDNTALFDVQPAIDSASGDLTFTLAANVSGSATVSVYLTDNGGTLNGGDDTSDTQTFTITVTDVNDEPSFTAGGDVSVFRGDGAYDAAWATDLNKGAANESAQTLTFNIVNNDNPGLFDSGPVIDGTTGNLSFTPSVTANGTANITVELQDDGGTADGGDDTSAQVTFAIAISGSQVVVDGNPSLSGDTITVPIDLNGTGAENSVSFTLDYDATQLVFDSGSAPAGTLVLNSATSGKVGVLVILGAGNTFNTGNNNIANLVFTLAGTATAGSSALGFSSTPVLQQVTEADASIIVGTTYIGATVTLSEGTLEGDVAPRPLGNGSLSIADATAIGRFAAGLDTANNGREFQAADSAPLATGGDGVISIADWVQNLRDVAGLDGAARALSGPTQPALVGASFSLRSLTLSNRRLSVESDPLVAGRAGIVRLVLDGSGDEAGFSCSLQFDPGSLAFVSATTATGGMLIVNQQQAANGTLGIVLAMQPGQTVPAGRVTLVNLAFNVSVNAASTTGVALNSSPVVEEITDATARRLPSMFVGQTFPIQLPAGFSAVGVTLVDGVPQFTFGNDDGSAVNAGQLADLEVYATSDIASSNWTRLDNALQLVNGKVRIVDPGAGNGLRFYQVRRAASSTGGSQSQ